MTTTLFRVLPILLAPVLLAAPAGAQSAVSEFQTGGLDVILKRIQNTPVVSAVLYLKGGSAVLKPEQAGIESFLFTAATRGTENYPKERLNALLERMGTGLGVDAQFDYTGLTMRCLREHFDASYDIFADVVQHPEIDSAEVEIVRQQMLTGLKQETENPDGYVFRIANNLFYAGHPYEIYYRGTEESVGAFSRGDLLAYHRRSFVKSRMLLVVVGDIDRKDLEARIGATLAALPQGSYTPPDLPAVLEREGARIEIVEREIPTTYIRGVHAAPPITSPDFYPFTIATSILRDRLFEEVRTKRNLSYAVSSGHAQRRTNYALVSFNTTAPDTTLKVIFEQVERLKNEPIPEKELKSQISLFITRYFLRLETAASQNEFLARYEIVGDGWEETERFVDMLRRVGPGDVQRVARKYMRNYHFGILGDPEKVDRQLFTSM